MTSTHIRPARGSIRQALTSARTKSSAAARISVMRRTAAATESARGARASRIPAPETSGSGSRPTPRRGDVAAPPPTGEAPRLSARHDELQLRGGGMESIPRPSGLVTFAGVLALMIGAFTAIAGLAGIFVDDQVNRQAGELLFGIGISVWGWITLAVGVVQVVIGVLIIQRQPAGLLLGIGWAVVSGTLTVFAIFSYPFFSVVVIGIDIIVIWALLAHADEFA